MEPATGKYLILAGIAIVILGVVVFFFSEKLNWIGRLPGDIRIQRENFTFFFPITTMILFSLLLTLIVAVVKKFL